MNEWDGELFDPATTPALCATPPVPGGELFLPLLQFIHTFCDRAYSAYLTCTAADFDTRNRLLVRAVPHNRSSLCTFRRAATAAIRQAFYLGSFQPRPPQRVLQRKPCWQ